MKRRSVLLACVLAGLPQWPVAGAQGLPEQSFRGARVAGNDMFSDAGNTPDAQLYADGRRAVRDSRWADAVSIFDRVVSANGEQAAGALYWKAYAQNKLGQGDKAVETCRSLRTQFAGSSWIDDCGALEIEIRASKGQVVEPEPGQSDDLKLLALATLMQKDPTRARTQIEEIVQGDSSEQLKEGAVFILGQSIPDVTYAQVVRISYLTGDVRIARGLKSDKRNGTWETAVANLPLSGGDSIVTGKDGNVEIELENASTIYLAPNSVLTCDDLHTTDGVPHSEIGLLSGTLTLHLDSLKPGETFIVKTHANELLARFPHQANERISSYLDGTAVTSLVGGMLDLPGSANQSLPQGKTLFFDPNHHPEAWDPAKGGDFSAFDAWVASRYGARTKAMAEEMKASGLTTPVPGLADMKGQGEFYACEPYGTCWEPAGATRNAALAAAPAPDSRARSATATTGNVPKVSNRGEFFPCLPGTPENDSVSPYTWAVCHAGSWIEQDHHYVWVCTRRIHHRCPVHWVKFGKTTAFVPIHPRDVKGQPPLNRERAFIPAKEKEGYSLKVVTFESGHPVVAMKSPPREFRNPPAPSLTRAATPPMMAYSLRQSGTKSTMATPVGEPIRFDHRTQSFSMGHQVVEGGHSRIVYTPVGHVGGGFEGSHSGASSGHGGANSGGSSQAGAGRASASSSGSSSNVSSTSSATNANSSAGSSRH